MVISPARLSTRLVDTQTALAQVFDPEIPTVSILELGMIHALREESAELVVEILPTFSGCPAISVIVEAVEAALVTAGLGPVRVITRFDLPWSTDLITEKGRGQMAKFGVVPPEPGRIRAEEVRCLVCGHLGVVLVSRFGPTPCRAVAKCISCGEPLELMKSIGQAARI
jgi:ring-1,2-phenylacetyl-CoA epoxidase subunit PaaD